MGQFIASINYEKEPRKMIFSDKKDLFRYFLELEGLSAKSIAENTIPFYERIEVLPTVKGNLESFDASFLIVGKYTKNVYETITVFIRDVSLDFPMKEYLSYLFDFRYNGALSKREDVYLFSDLINRKNNKESNILEIRDPEKSLIGRSFYVTYTLMNQKQTKFVEKNRRDFDQFIQYLIGRTKTHQVSIKIIDNELLDNVEKKGA